MKLPVAYTIGTRDSNLDKDALMKNALAEPDEAAKVIRARKRPAIDSAYTIATGVGQGLFTWTIADPDGDDDEVLVGISDDIVNTSPTPINKMLRFVVQPTAPSGIGEVISPAVTVEAVDLAGNRVTSFTSAVTVSLSTNPTGATLGGDLTNDAVAGLATFSDLELNRSGSDFQLGASGGGRRAGTSSVFTLATELVFTVQPASAAPDETLDPFEVTAEDLDGNTDTQFTGDVTISLYSADGDGELDGTLTVTAVAGVASFTNVSVTDEGTYALLAKCDEDGNNLATCYKPASANSDTFGIGDYILVAATSAGETGYKASPSLGSLTPSTFEGESITRLFSAADEGGRTILTIPTASSQSLFTSITFNGVTLLSADASTFIGGSWTWIGTQMFTTTGTFPGSIV